MRCAWGGSWLVKVAGLAAGSIQRTMAMAMPLADPGADPSPSPCQRLRVAHVGREMVVSTTVRWSAPALSLAWQVLRAESAVAQSCLPEMWQEV